MKKHVFTIAAILLAVGLSAFNVQKNKSMKFENLHWFEISGTLDEEDMVPRSNVVQYLGQSTTAPSIGCNESLYQCVSGFLDEQVEDGELIDDAQQPEVVAYKRN